MQMSMFNGAFSSRPTVIDSEDFWEDIRNGKWEREILGLRGVLSEKGKTEYDKLKRELFAVTMSGLFRGRGADTMVQYSGLLQGDIDNVDDPEGLRDELALDPHVRVSFLSPSGHGVKLAIKVPNDPGHHRDAFRAAEKYFKEKHKVTIDPSCKDINRICFTSFDPELKGNEDAIPLAVETEREFKFEANKATLTPTKSDYEKAEALVKNISPEDYHTWFTVACSLKSSLGENGFTVWDSWSQGSAKYDSSVMRKKWESISAVGGITGGTIGYLGREEETLPRPRKKATVIKKEEVKPVITDLLTPPGFVGNFAKYITDTAWFPQPELALGASFALAATLLGRKIRDQSDIRPNIYVAGLGRTGIGKEHARKLIKLLFSQTGIIGFGAEKLSSRSAIERTISATPSAIYLIDEFGHYISSIMNPNSNSHLRDVSSMFLELYGSSSSRFFGTDKANSKENPRFEIDQPSANIYGTSTPDSFWESLTSKAVRDGSLNRFLIFNAPHERPEVNEAELIRTLPANITNVAQQMASLSINPNARGDMVELGTPEPLVVPRTEGAKKIFRSFQNETLKLSDDNSETASMWVRAAESSKKIALILAGTRDNDIGTEEAEYGCELVRMLIRNACVSIRQNLSDNEYERESKRVESIIRNSGTQGISTKDLVQRTRFLKSRMYRKALLDDLFEAEIINKEARIVLGHQKSTMFWFCE